MSIKGGENVELKRYELRLYSSGVETPTRLLSYLPFETEQQAVDYFNQDDEMSEDWGLYLVRLTPNEDYATFIRKMKRYNVINKNDLRHIGHLRGIDQYEVINNEDLKLALVLKLGDKYYLSFACDEAHYNSNISARITLAYKAPQGIDTSCFGREVSVQ